MLAEVDMNQCQAVVQSNAVALEQRSVKKHISRKPEYVPMRMFLFLIGILIPASASADQLSDARAHLKHVVIIMQENRSFDHYFGTFPGADGIPAGVCVPINPQQPSLGCVKPFHDTSTIQLGSSIEYTNQVSNIDYGKMDGFVYQQIISAQRTGKKCQQVPQCASHDVMGYHTDAEIPNYWAYARNFVLQDRMFEQVQSWSEPSHYYMISEWSADCTSTDPLSCTTDVEKTGAGDGDPQSQILAWTPITWLLDNAGVSWRYYLGQGLTPDCPPNMNECVENDLKKSNVPTIWNPLGFLYGFARFELWGTYCEPRSAVR